MKRFILFIFLVSFPIAHAQVVNNGGGTDETPVIDADGAGGKNRTTTLHSSSKEIAHMKNLGTAAIKASRQQWKECHGHNAPFENLASFHDYVVIQKHAISGKIQLFEKCEQSKLDCVVRDPKVKSKWKDFLYNEHALNYLKQQFGLSQEKAELALKTFREIFPKEE